MAADIVNMPRRTYEAKLSSSRLSGLYLVVAGKLDGYLDFSIQPHSGNNLTYEITLDDARIIAAHLLSAIEDVQCNCLYERDALLMSEQPDFSPPSSSAEDLAGQGEEPFGYAYEMASRQEADGAWTSWCRVVDRLKPGAEFAKGQIRYVTPLYPKSFCDGDVGAIDRIDYLERQLAARAPDLAGQGEPVAWAEVRAACSAVVAASEAANGVDPTDEQLDRLWDAIDGIRGIASADSRPLYAAPAPSQPADREEIARAFNEAALARDEAGYLGTPADCIRALAEENAALRDAPRTGGDGWKLVPAEATAEMMRAFWLAGPYPEKPFTPGYRAMIAAAPLSNAGYGTQAARDVLAERRRQVEDERWTPEHDDGHTDASLAMAAACYAAPRPIYDGIDWPIGPRGRPTMLHGGGKLRYAWPWEHSWWKPSTPRRNLVKAGALILAEIERLDRLPSPNAGDGTQDRQGGGR